MTTSPSNCIEQDQLLDFLSDRLEDSDVNAVAEHIACCKHCQDAIEQLNRDDVVAAYFDCWQKRDPLPETAALGALRDELYRLNPDGPESAADKSGIVVQEHSPEHVGRLLRHQQGMTQLGRFEIKTRLGLGGFGIVYLAYDEVLKREIALKLPRDAALSDEHLRRRFLREAEAAAKLHHPNIVPVHEAGEEEGVCYIAAEYCSGPSLADWLARSPDVMSVNAAVRLILALAEAVEHAHRRGILHRDIKPSNVLLEPVSDDDELPFIPKLTDFGLAKFIGCEIHRTMTGMIMGTPQYMAPEQAGANHNSVSAATDVYSLGVILYEMLTGERPFDDDNQSKLLRQVVTDDARPPRRIEPRIPKDLEAICMRCLAKRPENRYASAAAMAEDLRRVLRGEATVARPDTPIRAAMRTAARYPAQTGLISALFMLFTVTVLGLWFHGYTVGKANQRLELSERRTRGLLYAADVKLAWKAMQQDDTRQMTELLRRHIPAAGEDDLRGFEWHYLQRPAARRFRTIATHDGAVYRIKQSPSGRLLASAGFDSVVRIIDATTFELKCELETGQGEVNGVAFNSDDRLLATAGDDGTVRVWDWQEKKLLLTIPAFDSLAFQVVFTPDDRELVTCGEDTDIRIWDATTGEPTGTLSGHVRAVEAIRLHTDGNTLISVSGDCRAWDLKARKAKYVYKGHDQKVVALAMDSKANLVATGSHDRTIQLWDASNGKRVAQYEIADVVQAITFSEDGNWVVVADRAGCLHRFLLVPGGDLRQPATLTKLATWQAHNCRIYDVVLSRDLDEVVSGGRDGSVRLWNRRVQPPKKRVLPPSKKSVISEACFGTTPDEVFVSCSTGVYCWSKSDNEYATLHAGSEFNHLAVSTSDVSLAAASSKDGTIMVFDTRTKSKITEWSRGDSVWELKFVPGTNNIAVIFTDEDDGVFFYDALTGAELRKYSVKPYCEELALDRTGRTLATDKLDVGVIFDVATGEQLSELHGHTNSIGAIAFSPDGTLLATGGNDRQIKLWDVEKGVGAGTLNAHRNEIYSLAFSPDGRTLASGDKKGITKLWHVETQQELCDCDEDTGQNKAFGLEFSEDGNWLLITRANEFRVLSAAAE